MRTITTIALLLAATMANAGEVVAIARSPTEAVELTDEPCPTNPTHPKRRLAIHNSYGLEKGTSYGCWWADPGSFVAFAWHQKINNQRAMPDRVSKIQFKKPGS